MKRTNWLSWSIVLVGVIAGSQAMSAEDEEKKKDADAERIEQKDSDTGEPELTPEQRSQIDKLVANAAELKARAERLSREGKKDESKLIEEEVRRLDTQMKGLVLSAKMNKDKLLLELIVQEKMLREKVGAEHPDYIENRARLQARQKQLYEEHRNQLAKARQHANQLFAANHEKLQELLLEDQKLRESYGSDHPKVVSLKNRIELLQKLLADQEVAAQDRGEQPSSIAVGEKQRRLHHLRQAAENLAAAGMREQAEQILRQADELRARERETMGYPAELGELHNQIRQLSERIERIEVMLRKLVEQQEQTLNAVKNIPR